MSMRPTGKRRRSNPFLVAAMVGMLVWFADQPAVPG